MAESTRSSSPNSPPILSSSGSRRSGLLLSAVAVVIISLLLVRLDNFDVAPYPSDELTRKPKATVPRSNSAMLRGSEKIGSGQLLGPEDVVYDPKLGVIYASCSDGWIKRVTVDDSVVENWVNTGGRPLGIAIGYSGEVYVADAFKGILKITENRELEILTNEAEGVKFGLTDAVTVAKSGMLYFTDASSKYDLHNFIYDMFEGRPYGRLMTYDPSTKETKVIVRDLYFANGVELSPDQDFLIFCETMMMRCSRYYIQGAKKGTIDVFVDNLPGMPDNIHYDGEGHYWIGLPMELTYGWVLLRKYPYMRKVFAFLEKYLKRPSIDKNSGTMAVDLDGNIIQRYYDPSLVLVTSGIKIGEHLYIGNLIKSHITRLNLTQYPAT